MQGNHSSHRCVAKRGKAWHCNVSIGCQTPSCSLLLVMQGNHSSHRCVAKRGKAWHCNVSIGTPLHVEQ
ncbi:hypothetical protein C4D60_Mb03t00340 [Musa balbisiana]|uniref:Uncharacterized protein n=1 Tax=Musa balbisiana TaxID=52838 RepID=A0A4S8J6H3_MUSBA|nr:hypothetical protein C4D60_Mb03t00340 [Musa balbisiana]